MKKMGSAVLLMGLSFSAIAGNPFVAAEQKMNISKEVCVELASGQLAHFEGNAVFTILKSSLLNYKPVREQLVQESKDINKALYENDNGSLTAGDKACLVAKKNYIDTTVSILNEEISSQRLRIAVLEKQRAALETQEAIALKISETKNDIKLSMQEGVAIASKKLNKVKDNVELNVNSAKESIKTTKNNVVKKVNDTKANVKNSVDQSIAIGSKKVNAVKENIALNAKSAKDNIEEEKDGFLASIGNFFSNLGEYFSDSRSDKAKEKDSK